MFKARRLDSGRFTPIVKARRRAGRALRTGSFGALNDEGQVQ